MAIEAEALRALEKAREELIVREARRREILDWLQEETGTDWKCTSCGYTTYHSCAVSCAECDEPFPFLNTLAFKLHANGTDNVDLIETVRAEFDAEQAFLPAPSLIHRSALAEDTARAVEDMRERCAEVALSLRHERSGEWHEASRDRAIGRRNRVLAEVASAIRALPLDKEVADDNR